MFKKAWKNENKGTSLFSLMSTETWTLPAMLLHLLFSLNEDIVPFNKKWSSYHIFETLSVSGRKPLSSVWAIGKVISKALKCCLDFHLLSSGTLMTASGVDEYEIVVQNVCSNLCMLWMVNSDLIISCKSRTNTNYSNKNRKNTTPFFKGIKPHLIEHYTFYMKYFGVDKRTRDKELSESFNKISVKANYETTNIKIRQGTTSNVNQLQT